MKIIHYSGTSDLDTVRNKLLNNPHTAEAFLDLAKAFLSEARIIQNETIYELAHYTLDIHDRFFQATPHSTIQRAHLLMQMHQFQEAENLARKLLKTSEAKTARIILGDALLDSGRLKKAEAYYNTAFRRSTDYSMLARFAALRWMQGRHEESITLWRQCQEQLRGNSKPERAWVTTHLSEALLKTGQLQEATLSAQQALVDSPDYQNAQFIKARIAWHSSGEISTWFNSFNPFSQGTSLEQRWWYEDILNCEQTNSQDQEIIFQNKGHKDIHDKRMAALYLSYREQNPRLASRLAREELEIRQDSLTQAIYALTLLKQGKAQEAAVQIQLSLKNGYTSGRAALIAANIAKELRDGIDFNHQIEIAYRYRFELTPTEIQLLNQLRRCSVLSF